MLRRLAAGLRAMAEYPNPDVMNERLWTGAAGVGTTAGVAVTAENALSLDVVQCCLDNLAGPLSTLPWGVFERISDDERRPAPDHPLSKVLRKPNEYQTRQEFRDEQQRHLGYYRNFYCEIQPGPDNAPIGALMPIHPKRFVKVEVQGDRRVYTFKNANGTGQISYRDDQIWHVRKAPLTDDGMLGKPVYDTGKEVIGRALAVKNYGSRWFVNSGKSGGILEHP
ncbi:MAG TPA: phage portal protein, partial [Dongiaceae bacterium]|nr:phage portal protein [Dongiaceae bacterium]